MAGLTLGNASHALSASGATTRRPLFRIPVSTRKRRLEGVCLAGEVLLSVYSTRSSSRAHGVSITLQDMQAPDRTSHLAPAAGRALAQALIAAASSAESLTHAED